MNGRSMLTSFDDTPVYTIKTVVQDTGITPATLRAWERRYHVLSPGRSDGGYRLYSERDIAILRWLKRQVDSGVAISRAVALLDLRHQAGEAPELAGAGALRRDDPDVAALEGARDLAAVTDELLEALLAYREERADTVLSEAFALFPVETVAENIIAPTLVEIGERWHRGQVTMVQEHFATAFLHRRLSTLFHAYDQPAAGPLVITGAAPSEWHDIGILMVSLALRRSGWRVLYLGQNVPGEQLVSEITRLRPEAVCLSATTLSSADALHDVYETVGAMPEPRPRLAFGGRAFNAHPELRASFPGVIMAATARELADRLPRR
jgi:DNA-binding transcriptional MerR regulator